MSSPLRRPLIAGNWKMNLDLNGANALVEGLKDAAAKATGVETIVAPPFTLLAAVAEAVKGSRIRCAAQNVHWAESGAFTGECAAASLKELGVDAAIIGHSERRQFFGETDKTVHDRLAAALNGNHRELLENGWSICPTSGLWRTGKGTLTARVAYRMRARKASLVHTVRGISPGLYDER